ncbi:hypothetical protein HYS54_04170 [Candidatus Micrarchaeota archaeon]|nr:hypothetical protein [Candidatus Micrarchaeota archaeon]
MNWWEWFVSEEELDAACKKTGGAKALTAKQREQVARRLKALIEISCPQYRTWIEQAVKDVVREAK